MKTSQLKSIHQIDSGHSLLTRSVDQIHTPVSGTYVINDDNESQENLDFDFFIDDDSQEDQIRKHIWIDESRVNIMK